MFENVFETMLILLSVFRMSQKDGAKVVIIFDTANTFAKKNAQESSPERFLEVFIDVCYVIQQFLLA